MFVLSKKIIVAVDGFSSCGKSTFARKIATLLGYTYIDSGAMYRAVAYFAIQNNLASNGINEADLKERLSQISIGFMPQAKGNAHTILNGTDIEKEIRGAAVSNLVSEVSKIKEVRNFLVSQQQNIGQGKGIVMDGRDIGTVVFPDADIKIFMKADSRVRAQRRFDELVEKGMEQDFESIVANIEARDQNDLNRSESPLRQAIDAIVLDNTYMSIDEQMEWFTTLLKERMLLV